MTPAITVPPRDRTIDTTPDPDQPTTAQIRHLLTEHDGCLWQRELTTAIDVSKATISRHLGTLEADGRVNRYEFNGEKLVTLPDRTIELTG